MDVDRLQCIAAQHEALLKTAGYKDKAGEPYFEHLTRVALKVSGFKAKAVAFLHDLVEDGHCRMDYLSGYFDEEVCSAVDAITKRADESYGVYLSRVRSNSLALEVKRADIADNSNEERLSKLDDATATRLRKKYSRALEILDEK